MWPENSVCVKCSFRTTGAKATAVAAVAKNVLTDAFLLFDCSFLLYFSLFFFFSLWLCVS